MKKQPAKTPYILWANDDADDMMIVRETIDAIHPCYTIIEAKNGLEVLDYLDSINDPDQWPILVVLDMNMPVISGRETLVSIRKQKKYSSIPVVFFTTSCSEMDRLFCARHGVEMYTKPDNFKDYVDTFQKLLSRNVQQVREKVTG